MEYKIKPPYIGAKTIQIKLGFRLITKLGILIKLKLLSKRLQNI